MNENGEIFRCDDRGLFMAGTEPGFTIGSASKKSNPADYSLTFAEIRKLEKRFMSGAVSIPEARVLFLNQVHGDGVLAVDSYPPDNSDYAGDADAAVTTLPGLCLVIRTADCVPVFLVDPVRRALGAVHSGWKGTRLEISVRALETMERRYGSSPSDIRAYLLPSIGPESYRVNRDVFDLFTAGRIESGGGLYLDLWANIESSLVRAGVPAERIYNSRTCTLRRNDEFFSHRGGDRGRNLNFGIINFR